VFRSVLVGYEGSERSEDALALGRALAGPAGTVTAACSYWWQPLSARAAVRGHGGLQLRSGAEETLASLHGREGAVVRTVPAPGATPAQSLLDLIDERDFDLVVVGSTHRGAAGRILAGTTADALLRGGPCPVAVAPLGYRDRAPDELGRIGVAFDGSGPARAALAAAHGLATELGAQLVVLEVFAPVPVLAAGAIGYGGVADECELRAAAREELDAAVAGLGGAAAVAGELLEGDPGRRLAQRSADLDLLVVGSKGHGALGRVLLGSVSHHLMCDAPTPVLVMSPQ
jgi:nucleotide-binding universal stress UspA family protein